ncbi:hypothetical protein GCK72_008840 [Caenorhabditis remanei]|uniref:Uncharacterized protein n=1 Tax=Caenorhabditis remanei TaxID=31234 RepID=A0A6A5H0Q4_CAERE|nr:hypothetical protein GCK72_008840 [Caenorhabditis remanei]KAF1760591.1 hypothetical protein GCK72_008840 [Caenorhabditis remanei]
MTQVVFTLELMKPWYSIQLPCEPNCEICSWESYRRMLVDKCMEEYIEVDRRTTRLERFEGICYASPTTYEDIRDELMEASVKNILSDLEFLEEWNVVLEKREKRYGLKVWGEKNGIRKSEKNCKKLWKNIKITWKRVSYKIFQK